MKLSTIYNKLFVKLCIVLILFVQGCAGLKNSHRDNLGYTQKKKEYLAKAQLLVQQASKSDVTQKSSLWLNAAHYYLKSENPQLAEPLLLNVENNLNQTQQNLFYILMAKLSLQKQNLTLAKQYLANIWSPATLANEQQVLFFTTRQDLLLRQHRFMDAAQDGIQLSMRCVSIEDKKIHYRNIVKILSQLTPYSLRALQQTPQSTEMLGWLAFVHCHKQYDTSDEQLHKALALWAQRFNQHPANFLLPNGILNKPFALSTLHNQHINTNTTPKIALLLPLEGTYAAQAQSIRDGFLAAYYQQKHKISARVKIYSTTLHKDIKKTIEMAIQEGANFIVGPLQKHEVESLSNLTSLPVPVLALNTLPKPQKTSDNLYQFGLPPETEALAIAEKAWGDGHRRVLILSPDSEWGRRINHEFVQQWHTLGGTIVANELLESKHDLNKTIKRLLRIDLSEARGQALKNAGLKFQFKPKRRQDIDLIVLTTNAVISRQIKPLLNFYYADNIPVYANSSLYAGKNTAQDHDLNGIQFCDMPWMLDPSINRRNVYQSLTSLWPNNFKSHSRLYALGLDAFKITTHLAYLQAYPQFGISGMTGILSLDDNHCIKRKLTWATFNKGEPQILGEHNHAS